ncbi:MAG TPA: hypothetical protein PKG83_04310 [bacterium]|nr:hypothetical protein [bacterium]HNW09192.1 hypothetical protein [bacterium]
MNIKTKKIILWLPRILGIVFVLFLALFSLDVFDGTNGFWLTVVALFMHNIPSLALLVVILLSWRYPLVGAIVFGLAGLAYVVMVAVNQSWYIAISWSLIIAGPAILIAVLFFLSWRAGRRW